MKYFWRRISRFSKKVWNTILWLPTARVWRLPAYVELHPMSNSAKPTLYPLKKFINLNGSYYHEVFNFAVERNGYTYTLSPAGWMWFVTENGYNTLVDPSLPMLPYNWEGDNPETKIRRDQILCGDELVMPLAAEECKSMPLYMQNGDSSHEFLDKLGAEHGFQVGLKTIENSQMNAYLRPKFFSLTKPLIWVEYEWKDKFRRYAVFVKGIHTFDICILNYGETVYIDSVIKSKVTMK